LWQTLSLACKARRQGAATATTDVGNAKVGTCRLSAQADLAALALGLDVVRLPRVALARGAARHRMGDLSVGRGGDAVTLRATLTAAARLPPAGFWRCCPSAVAARASRGCCCRRGDDREPRRKAGASPFQPPELRHRDAPPAGTRASYGGVCPSSLGGGAPTDGLEVRVVAPEARPMEIILGPEVGDLVREVHEQHGVAFHLGTTAVSLDRNRVTLKNGYSSTSTSLSSGSGCGQRSRSPNRRA
jgi:hypothetical protein